MTLIDKQLLIDFWFGQYCAARRQMWVAADAGDVDAEMAAFDRVQLCRRRYEAERVDRYTKQPK